MEDEFARVDVSRCETREKGYGRVERRSYYILDVPPELPDAARWKGIEQIAWRSATARRATTCGTTS